jgi:hypothetical protein
MSIYVGNLPYSTTSDEFEALFAAHGSVDSAQVTMDRATGRWRLRRDVLRRRGARRHEALDGQDVGGRNLTVNEARPRSERRGGGGGGGYREGRR